MNVRSFISCFLCFLVLLSFFCFQCSAMTYPDEMPDYIPYYGVTYIEVISSNLGQGAFIFPCKTQTLTFSRTVTGSFINVSDSTVSGIWISSRGATVYNVRVSFLVSPEYRDTSYTSQYHSIDVTEVLNTNVSFIDTTGHDTQNDRFFLTPYEKLLLSFIVFDLFISGISLFIKVKRSLYD